ncbi:hypothetical protein R5R35_006668 [Gryllus longicercus]|uniref:Thyroglobulin type-1 domain-containing protein n=1 Tax=Gryllus longicercus TaxID=2509291 RepID=A0AAN9VXY8_9ORTH
MRGPERRAALSAVVLCVAAAVAAEWDAWRPSGKCAISPAPCPAGEVEIENRSVYNICPGCVKTLGENENCDVNSDPCPHSFVCEGGKCLKGECRKEQDKEHATWTPKCDRISNFMPVQCKGSRGDGRCFCWSPKGERLFGEAAWTDATETNMHCSCSLRAWQLKQEGKGAHEAPRCAADGSFEALQCARGVCWCADAKTGAPIRRVVPEGAARLLFCCECSAPHLCAAPFARAN